MAGKGGAYNYGTLFRMSTSGAITKLYDFGGGPDGSGPTSLLQGSDGNLYGSGTFTFKYTLASGQISTLRDIL